MSECSHDGTFEQTTDIGTAEIDGQRAWFAMLEIRCGECRQRFAWRGFNSGQANPKEAVVSADGYELRAPITPQPLGVVGMLRSAGLEHLLGPDGPRLG